MKPHPPNAALSALPAEGPLPRLRAAIVAEIAEVREKGERAARLASWLPPAFVEGQLSALEDVLDAIEFLETSSAQREALRARGGSVNMDTTNQTTEEVGHESQRDSQQRLDGRVCGTIDTQTRTWWVVEIGAADGSGKWFETTGRYDSIASANLRIADVRGWSDRAMRVVEVVVRRTVVERDETGSPISVLNKP